MLVATWLMSARDSPCVSSDFVSLQGCLGSLKAGGTVLLTGEIQCPNLGCMKLTIPKAAVGATIFGSSSTSGITRSNFSGGATLTIQADNVTIRGLSFIDVPIQTTAFDSCLACYTPGVKGTNCVKSHASGLPTGIGWKTGSTQLSVGGTRGGWVESCKFLNSTNFGIAAATAEDFTITKSIIDGSCTYGIWSEHPPLQKAGLHWHVTNSHLGHSNANAVLASMVDSVFQGNILEGNHRATLWIMPDGGGDSGGSFVLTPGSTGVSFSSNEVFGAHVIKGDQQQQSAGVELGCNPPGVQNLRLLNNNIHDNSGFAMYANIGCTAKGSPAPDAGIIADNNRLCPGSLHPPGHIPVNPAPKISDWLTISGQSCCDCPTPPMPRGSISTRLVNDGDGLVVEWSTTDTVTDATVCYRDRTKQPVSTVMGAGGNCSAYHPAALFAEGKSGRQEARWAKGSSGVFELWWEGYSWPLDSSSIAGLGLP